MTTTAALGGAGCQVDHEAPGAGRADEDKDELLAECFDAEFPTCEFPFGPRLMTGESAMSIEVVSVDEAVQLPNGYYVATSEGAWVGTDYVANDYCVTGCFIEGPLCVATYADGALRCAANVGDEQGCREFIEACAGEDG